MILIDNAAYSYFFQLENGIPIIPYYEGKNDFELKALQGYIEKLLLINDMRIVNIKTFKLSNYVQYDEE
jgi:CTD small phosphatase-like protein 2